MANKDASDSEFAARMLVMLPKSDVPHALESRILSDFAAVTARRRPGLRWSLSALAGAVWPGAPLWQPGAVLAASLACGLAMGAFVPASNTVQETPAAPSQPFSEASPALNMLGDL